MRLRHTHARRALSSPQLRKRQCASTARRRTLPLLLTLLLLSLLLLLSSLLCAAAAPHVVDVQPDVAIATTTTATTTDTSPTSAHALVSHYTFRPRSMVLFVHDDGTLAAHSLLGHGAPLWRVDTGGPVYAVRTHVMHDAHATSGTDDGVVTTQQQLQQSSSSSLLHSDAYDPLSRPFVLRGNALYMRVPRTHVSHASISSNSSSTNSSNNNSNDSGDALVFFMDVTTLLRRRSVVIGGTDVYATSTTRILDVNADTGDIVAAMPPRRHRTAKTTARAATRTSAANTTNTTAQQQQQQQRVVNEFATLLHVVRYDIVLHAYKPGAYHWSLTLAQLQLHARDALAHTTLQQQQQHNNVNEGDEQQQEQHTTHATSSSLLPLQPQSQSSSAQSRPRFFASRVLRDMLVFDEQYSVYTTANTNMTQQLQQQQQQQQSSQDVHAALTTAAAVRDTLVVYAVNKTHVALHDVVRRADVWHTALVATPIATQQAVQQSPRARTRTAHLAFAYVWLQGNNVVARVPIWRAHALTTTTATAGTSSSSSASSTTTTRLLPPPPPPPPLLLLPSHTSQAHDSRHDAVAATDAEEEVTTAAAASGAALVDANVGADVHAAGADVWMWPYFTPMDDVTSAHGGGGGAVVYDVTHDDDDDDDDDDAGAMRGEAADYDMARRTRRRNARPRRLVWPAAYALSWRTVALLLAHVVLLVCSLGFLYTGVHTRARLQHAWAEADHHRDARCAAVARMQRQRHEQQQQQQKQQQQRRRQASSGSSGSGSNDDDDDAHVLTTTAASLTTRQQQELQQHDDSSSSSSRDNTSSTSTATSHDTYTRTKTSVYDDNNNDTRNALTWSAYAYDASTSSTQTSTAATTEVDASTRYAPVGRGGGGSMTTRTSNSSNSSSSSSNSDNNSRSHRHGNGAAQAQLFQQQFRVLGKLGVGGGGCVFQVEHRVTHTRYAIKVIQLHNNNSSNNNSGSSSNNSDDDDDDAREVREAVLHSSFDHPHVVRFYFCWIETLSARVASQLQLLDKDDDDDDDDDDDSADTSDEDTDTSSLHRRRWRDNNNNTAAAAPPLPQSYRLLFIQMEYFVHGTLADWLRTRTHCCRADNLRYLLELADGLLYLHDSDVVHRDLKPTNIFVSNTGVLKIGDFGLAKQRAAVAAAAAAAAAAHAHAHTHAYEQRQNGYDGSSSRCSSDGSSRHRKDADECEECGSCYASNSNSISISSSAAAGGGGGNGVACATETSVVAGSPLYCSPEQQRGEVAGKPSDIYSLGVIAVELYCTFTTLHERIRLLTEARRGCLPAHLLRDYAEESALFACMLRDDAAQRPATRVVVQTLRTLYTTAASATTAATLAT